jgi:hypothetical protein
VKAPRGAPHVPLLGDGDEVADLREAHAPSMSRRVRLRKNGGQIQRVLDALVMPAAWSGLR